MDLGATANLVAAVVVLAVAAGLGILFARRLGGRWSVAVAMAWGLAWIAVGRLGDEPSSVATGVAAVVAAALVLVAAWRWHTGRTATPEASRPLRAV